MLMPKTKTNCIGLTDLYAIAVWKEGLPCLNVVGDEVQYACKS